MKTPSRKDYELAAKAAGIVIKWSDADIPLADYFAFDVAPCGRWNPLTDDGDSRRLQVACGITLHVINCGKDDKEDGFCSASAPGITTSIFVANCGSIEEAARIAVFEIAVELGRKIKCQKQNCQS